MSLSKGLTPLVYDLPLPCPKGFNPAELKVLDIPTRMEDPSACDIITCASPYHRYRNLNWSLGMNDEHPGRHLYPQSTSGGKENALDVLRTPYVPIYL